MDEGWYKLLDENPPHTLNTMSWKDARSSRNIRCCSKRQHLHYRGIEDLNIIKKYLFILI